MRTRQNESYGVEYATIYDGIYPVPDYSPDFIRSQLEQNGPISEVLDLGCGTGRHAVGLPYRITGIDRSPHMLKIAEQKLPQHDWMVGTIAEFDLERSFDGAYMLSDILSYHLTNAAVNHALCNIAAHLKSGATLLLDCWYGPAVLTNGPHSTVKSIGNTYRHAASIMDYVDNICKVHYTFSRGNDENWHEDHQLRYFFVPELTQFLEQAGFKLRSITNKNGQRPSIADWHVIATATCERSQ